jgi:hypothetical protein
MKKRIQLLLGATLIVFMGLGQAFGQTIIAADSAGNYSSWSNGDDQGYGFTSWTLETITNGGSAGHFIGSSSAQGFGDINTSSKAFGMYGNPNPGSGQNQANAFRYVNETGSELSSNGRGYLLEGQKLEFDLAVAFRNGYKGVDLVDTANGFLWNFNVQSDDYTVTTDGSLGWGYSQTSIFEISVNQVSSTQFQVTVVRGDSTYTSSNITGKVSGFKIYVGNTDAGNDLNNLFSNNFSVTTTNFYRSVTGSAGFRLMSSPITTSYSDILDEIWTQGASSGADATNGDPNVFGWKWNVLSPEWETLTNLSANISTGIGFLVYVFADDDYDGSADAFPKTLSVSGTEHSGNVEPNINTDNDVYQLFGNPYASTIDFDDITKTNLTNVAYVWDPNAGGSGEWETWNGTTGDLTGGLIAPFQGFFIQTASSGTPDITITEASKSSNGSFLGKAVEEPQKIRFEVEGNGFSNSAFLQFGINGSPTEKVIGDAEELTSLSSSFAQLSFAKADGLFDIANIGNPTEEVTIPLDFTSSTGGFFTLSATDFDVSSNYDLTFHDYKTGESLLIDESFRYSFETQRLKPQEVPVLTSLTAWAIKAKSSESNRFGITLTPSTSVSIDDEIDAPTEFTLGQNYPNPFNPTTNINYSVGEAGPVNITVYNVMGQKVAELLNTTKNAGSYQITWNATGVASGIYYYRLTAPGQVLTRQMTLIK